jgi:hypothetical protein
VIDAVPNLRREIQKLERFGWLEDDCRATGMLALID